LAQGQELTGRKRRTKTSLQERKKEKTYLTLTGLLMEGVGQNSKQDSNEKSDYTTELYSSFAGNEERIVVNQLQ
jgi:hypothetical protein